MYVDEKKSGETTYTLDLPSLIAWLETQPPETEYDWENCQECLVGKFVTAITGNRLPASVIRYSTLFPSCDAYGFVGATGPWTFGAALARAKQIQLTTASNSAI